MEEKNCYSPEEIAEMMKAYEGFLLSFFPVAEIEPDPLKFPQSLKEYNENIPRNVQRASHLELLRFEKSNLEE